MMRLDEIGENYKDLKVKVISYTTNKADQDRGGQKESHVPMTTATVATQGATIQTMWTKLEIDRYATTVGRKDISRGTA